MRPQPPPPPHLGPVQRYSAGRYVHRDMTPRIGLQACSDTEKHIVCYTVTEPQPPLQEPLHHWLAAQSYRWSGVSSVAITPSLLGRGCASEWVVEVLWQRHSSGPFGQAKCQPSAMYRRLTNILGSRSCRLPRPRERLHMGHQDHGGAAHRQGGRSVVEWNCID